MMAAPIATATSSASRLFRKQACLQPVPVLRCSSSPSLSRKRSSCTTSGHSFPTLFPYPILPTRVLSSSSTNHQHLLVILCNQNCFNKLHSIVNLKSASATTAASAIAATVLTFVAIIGCNACVAQCESEVAPTLSHMSAFLYRHHDDDDDVGGNMQQQQQQQLPNFGSSSDPVSLPTENVDGIPLSQIVLRPMEYSQLHRHRRDDDLLDEGSCLSRSIRAFGTSMDTVMNMMMQRNISNNINNNEGAAQKQEEEEDVTSQSSISPENNKNSTSIEQRRSSTVTTRKMYFYKTSQIESPKLAKFVLVAGPSSEELGSDIAHLLGVPVSKMDVGKFEDGETAVQVQVSVRGKHVYVVNSTTSNTSIVELLLLVSALRRASAKWITVVIPYFGYCRQDQRKANQREPIAAADIARMLDVVGVDRVICMDLHNDQVRGFFPPRIPVEHLMPAPVAAAYFHEELSALPPPQEYTSPKLQGPSSPPSKSFYPPVTVVASHENMVGRASQFRDVLQRLSGSDDVEIAVLSRSRIQLGERTYQPNLVGNVKNRTCILIDDIVNTGTTLVSNVQQLKRDGAKDIYAWATHGVFGTPDSTSVNDAPTHIQQLDELQFLLMSNSVANPMITLPSKIRILNMAPLLTEAITRAVHDQSISSILSWENREELERYDG